MQFAEQTMSNEGPSCSFSCPNLSCFAALVLFVFLYRFVKTPPSSACADIVHAGTVDAPAAELSNVHDSLNLIYRIAFAELHTSGAGA